MQRKSWNVYIFISIIYIYYIGIIEAGDVNINI